MTVGERLGDDVRSERDDDAARLPRRADRRRAAAARPPRVALGDRRRADRPKSPPHSATPALVCGSIATIAPSISGVQPNLARLAFRLDRQGIAQLGDVLRFVCCPTSSARAVNLIGSAGCVLANALPS